MTKLFLLGANKELDTAIQTVAVNQVIRMEGYSYDKYVVYEISKTKWGIHYKLINLKTKDFGNADIIRPLSEKFGIGYYYDDKNPVFMDETEVAVLLQEAQAKRVAEAEAAEKEKIRIEEVKKIGRERFAGIFPDNAQAVIVARLKQNESDSQMDYYGSSIQRTVILGFSTHKRDIFSEMRKHAPNFEGTAHLAEYNKDYEHREKYSMGEGYYLGKNKYWGWIIEKVRVYDRNSTIEGFSYIAGDEDNIHIKQTKPTPANEKAEIITGDFIIVDYSEKAIAIFGDTRPIKEKLSAMGGRFNSRLTYNGKKVAGWVFQKSKEEELRKLVNIGK